MESPHAGLLARFYEALTRRDVDALMELCHEDVEVYKAPGVVEMVSALTPRGRPGVAHWLEGWLASWDLYEPQVHELRGSGDEVVALTAVRSRGRGSQFDLEEEMADAFAVRDGKIARMRLYVTRDQALRDVGLSA